MPGGGEGEDTWPWRALSEYGGKKNMKEIEAGQQEVIYNKYDTITYHISYHILLILLPH